MTTASKKRNLLVFTGIAAVMLAVAISIFYITKTATPANSVFEKRLEATIALGWGWLHAEKTTVTSLDCTGGLCQATIQYTLVIDKNEMDLLPEQIQGFRHFLPMCSDVLLLKGSKCAVTEVVAFTNNAQYGWVPLAAEQLNPGLLPAIAGWETNATPR